MSCSRLIALRRKVPTTIHPDAVDCRVGERSFPYDGVFPGRRRSRVMRLAVRRFCIAASRNRLILLADAAAG